MPKIMKLTDIGCTDEQVQRYIEDDNWIMQQKFDGTRVMATYDPVEERINWSNNGVDPLTHAAAKLKVGALEDVLLPAFFRMGRHMSIDGELLIRTGEYIVWDYMEEGAPFDPTWNDRHDDLEKFFQLIACYRPDQELVKLTPTARTSLSKWAMWEEIKAANVEGAVSKHVTSLYIPGTRSKDWVKHKLVKTADLVVMDVKRTFKPNSTVVHKGSAMLGISERGIVTQICSASLIGKDLTISAGDVVEVNYLYREPGSNGGLVQPRIVRKRWDAATKTGDKRPEECGSDQFPVYSRSVVTI